MSNDTNYTMDDEPVLGDVTPLSDEAWDGMLDDTFMAPPGAADHLVDSFDPVESSEYEIDADTATDDGAAGTDPTAGTEGADGAEGAEDADDTLDDDVVDDLAAEDDRIPSQPGMPSQGGAGVATDADAVPEAAAAEEATSEAGELDPFGFDLDVLNASDFDSGTAEFDTEPFTSDDFSIDTTELAPETEHDLGGEGLDGDLGDEGFDGLLS